MLTEEQIKKGLDEAYREAGGNAYFGNGFLAGVRFALEENTCKVCGKKGVLICGECYDDPL